MNAKIVKLPEEKFPERIPLEKCRKVLKAKENGYSDEEVYQIIEPSKDASIVRFAFEELAKGVKDIEAIRRMVNQKGLKVSRSAFWYLVRNPVYCGKIFIPAWKDEEAHYVKASHEPLIPESLFEEVQDVLHGRKRKFP